MCRTRDYLVQTFILFCLTIPGGLISCGDDEPVFEPITYQLKQELIETAVNLPEIAISIASPAGWTTVDSENLDGFRKMMAGTPLSRNLFPVYPLTLFSDSTLGTMMYVAAVEESLKDFSKMADDYHQFLKDRRKGADLALNHLIINGLKIYQFRLQTPQMVNYKLLGESAPGKRFLIEYVVPGGAFRTQLLSINSSMASMTVIDK